MEQVIQIDEPPKTPLSIHGINKQITSQNSFAFSGPSQGSFAFGVNPSSQNMSMGCVFPKPNTTHSSSFQPSGLQMCGGVRLPQNNEHPKIDSGQPINRVGFQFGMSTDRKQHLDTLYNELNNMRNNIDKCNKTLDNVYYSNELLTDQVHTEYNNLREYYNNITKSIDKFYETLRFIN